MLQRVSVEDTMGRVEEIARKGYASGTRNRYRVPAAGTQDLQHSRDQIWRHCKASSWLGGQLVPMVVPDRSIEEQQDNSVWFIFMSVLPFNSCRAALRSLSHREEHATAGAATCLLKEEDFESSERQPARNKRNTSWSNAALERGRLINWNLMMLSGNDRGRGQCLSLRKCLFFLWC